MRQSFNKIRSLLIQHGIDPKNKLGQNFLVDLNILDLVLDAAELDRSDSVLEVGPGTGVLTQRLVSLAGFVLSVEIDQRFGPIILSQIPQDAPFRLHWGDILQGKNRLDPDVLAAWTQGGPNGPLPRTKLVSNLPYSVATPVLANLLIDGPPPERMVGMVQWETAERFIAQPGSPQYAGLAALVTNLASAKIHRKIAPTVFFPKPKVDSALLEVRPDPQKRDEVNRRLGAFFPGVGGPRVLRAFLRDLFVHRRKTLRGALMGIPEGKVLGKAGPDRLLETLGMAPETRAEQLDPGQLLELCVGWRELLKQAAPVDTPPSGHEPLVDED